MPLHASTRRLTSLGLAAAAARMSRTLQQPRRSQERTLRLILEGLQDTESGGRSNLRGIDSIEAFRSRVPVSTRDEIRFDLQRTVAGAPDVLVPGRAVGGRATMSAPPRGVIIPVTPRCLGRAARDASAAWIAGLARRRPRILGGEVLVLPPVRPPAARWPDAVNAGTRIGQLTDTLPTALRRRLALPAGLLDGVPERELPEGARRRLLMRLALARDVRLVIGGDPAELAACFGAADEAAEAIIRDIRDGTFACAGPLPASLEQALARRFPRDRDRARDLARGRDVRDGRLLPVEAWSLEAVGCLAQGREVTLRAWLDPWLDPWRRGTGPVVVDLGVLTAEAHLAHAAVVRPDAVIVTGDVAAVGSPDGTIEASTAAMDAPFGGGPLHDPAAMVASSPASPAATAIASPALGGSSAGATEPPMQPSVVGRPRLRPWVAEEPVPGPLLVGGGPATLEGCFQEFVELEAIEADPDAPERWTFHDVDALRDGGRYAVFVTTFGGLLRAETRDVVAVVGRDAATPRLRWAGRTAGILGQVP